MASTGHDSGGGGDVPAPNEISPDASNFVNRRRNSSSRWESARISGTSLNNVLICLEISAGEVPSLLFADDDGCPTMVELLTTLLTIVVVVDNDDGMDPSRSLSSCLYDDYALPYEE